jgi:hypothetical protein
MVLSPYFPVLIRVKPVQPCHFHGSFAPLFLANTITILKYVIQFQLTYFPSNSGFSTINLPQYFAAHQPNTTLPVLFCRNVYREMNRFLIIAQSISVKAGNIFGEILFPFDATRSLNFICIFCKSFTA